MVLQRVTTWPGIALTCLNGRGGLFVTDGGIETTLILTARRSPWGGGHC
jgi:hypothetical protein